MDQKFGIHTAITLVAGSMIGTGVFVSLGFQLVEFHSGFVIAALWILGGICALCGALCYSELAVALPKSGGEYNYLRETFHPAIGFVAAWISVTVGFAGPIALVALAFGKYFHASFPLIDPQWAAIALIILATGIHMHSHRSSGGFQTMFTYLKIALIGLFCIATWVFVKNPQSISFAPKLNDITLFASSGFAVSLIYVNYAYLGWNASTYVAEEIANPAKTISRALLIGTSLVIVLYLMLNYTFLYAAPAAAMEGKEEIGYVVAQYAFGEVGATLISLLIALLLISTLSAMVLSGPRVLSRVGADYPVVGWLANTNKRGIPVIAIGIQSGLALAIILTSTFDSLLVTASLLFGPSMFAACLACMWRRWKYGPPDRYRMPLYPLPPLLFLVVNGWMMAYVAWDRWIEGVIAISMITIGFALYLLLNQFNKRATEQI